MRTIFIIIIILKSCSMKQTSENNQFCIISSVYTIRWKKKISTCSFFFFLVIFGFFECGISSLIKQWIWITEASSSKVKQSQTFSAHQFVKMFIIAYQFLYWHLFIFFHSNVLWCYQMQFKCWKSFINLLIISIYYRNLDDNELVQLLATEDFSMLLSLD